MCFTITNNYKISEGRYCFKVMRMEHGKLHSDIWNSHISRKLGDTIKAAKMPKRWYHRFLPIRYQKKYAAEYLNNQMELNGEVVHAFSNTEYISMHMWDSNNVVVKCFIPPGEFYWETDDEVAAFSIKLLNLVDVKEPEE